MPMNRRQLIQILAALESHVDELQENLESADDAFRPYWDSLLQDTLGAYDNIRTQLKALDKRKTSQAP